MQNLEKVASKGTLSIRGMVGIIAVGFIYIHHNKVLASVSLSPSERLRCAAHAVSFCHAYDGFFVLCWWIALMGG